MIYAHIITTPIGHMLAKANDDALIYLDFLEEGSPFEIQDKNLTSPLLKQLELELTQYFEKKRHFFTLPLDPDGTTFQKSVWETLLKIPYASTISYADEARLFGNPKASRAVANANGKNPISILIPCHRVIASDGSLGGYSGGLWRKEFLLSHERVGN